MLSTKELSIIRRASANARWSNITKSKRKALSKKQSASALARWRKIKPDERKAITSAAVSASIKSRSYPMLPLNELKRRKKPTKVKGGDAERYKLQLEASVRSRQRRKLGIIL